MNKGFFPSAAEWAVSAVLLRNPNRWMSTYEIAQQAGMSWETATKVLNSLFKKGYLHKGKKGGRTYWSTII